MGIIAKDDKCSGCRTCQVVCALENFGEVNPSKAALGIEGRFPAPGKYNVRSCDQCGDCFDVCPAGAIYKKEEAEYEVYLIEEERCVGCLMCVMGCSKAALFRHKELETPIKCTSCGECVDFCSREALAEEEEIDQRGGYN